MNVSAEQSLGEIVLQHPTCARVFDAHHLDFCCGGKEALATACERLGLDAAAIVSALRAAAGNAEPAHRRPADMSTLGLVAHIVERYHGELRQVLPAVVARAQKVARVHGPREEMMVRLAAVVERLANTLDAHLAEEEAVLFPRLLATDSSNPAPDVVAGIGAMEAEHEAVAAMMCEIRSLAEEFQPPEWACTTARVLFAELEALEREIHEHVHLENFALAPRFRGRH